MVLPTELPGSKIDRLPSAQVKPSSVIRLSLGRRSVNLLPVAQRTNAFTNGVVGRTMGPWSWVRISRPPWKRFLKKSEFPHVKNLKNASGSPEIGTTCWWHVDPYIRSVPGGVLSGLVWVGDCYPFASKPSVSVQLCGCRYIYMYATLFIFVGRNIVYGSMRRGDKWSCIRLLGESGKPLLLIGHKISDGWAEWWGRGGLWFCKMMYTWVW